MKIESRFKFGQKVWILIDHDIVQATVEGMECDTYEYHDEPSIKICVYYADNISSHNRLHLFEERIFETREALVERIVNS